MELPVGYMQPPRYIQPSALAEILRNPDPSAKRPLIIDVRDTDYAGGHIRSAVNIPEENFMDDDDVDALVDKYKDQDAIVFHCMMSQVRGPSCAKRFKSRMEVVLEEAPHKPRILILHGGYERFGMVQDAPEGDRVLFAPIPARTHTVLLLVVVGCGQIYKGESDLIEMDD